jgi:hypothetical protein
MFVISILANDFVSLPHCLHTIGKNGSSWGRVVNSDDLDRYPRSRTGTDSSNGFDPAR